MILFPGEHGAMEGGLSLAMIGIIIGVVLGVILLLVLVVLIVIILKRRRFHKK